MSNWIIPWHDIFMKHNAFPMNCITISARYFSKHKLNSNIEQTVVGFVIYALTSIIKKAKAIIFIAT